MIRHFSDTAPTSRHIGAMLRFTAPICEVRSCVGPTPLCSETSPTSFRMAVLGPTSFRHRGSVVRPPPGEMLQLCRDVDNTAQAVQLGDLLDPADLYTS